LRNPELRRNTPWSRGGIEVASWARKIHYHHHPCKEFLDSRILMQHSCAFVFAVFLASTPDPVMISALRRSSNPGNNRPLPQNLWDAIERLG
jgi:hypothetical protein